MPNPKKPCAKCRREVCPKLVKRHVDTFCSMACQHLHEYEEYVKAWLAGEKDGAKGVVEVSDHVRRWVKETQGEACLLCGWAVVNEHTGKIPLHLDHIDGSWKNNQPENLRLICPNCHALTATYGARNRGGGRPFFVQKKALL
jgi:hypothetical protein